MTIVMYLIAYEVKRRNIAETNSVRETIEDEVVSFGSWWRYFGDVWIVDTDKDVDEMTDIIIGYMDQRDNLLIIGIQSPYQGWLPEDAWKWLNKATHRQKQETTSAS